VPPTVPPSANRSAVRVQRVPSPGPKSVSDLGTRPSERQNLSRGSRALGTRERCTAEPSSRCRSERCRSKYLRLRSAPRDVGASASVGGTEPSQALDPKGANHRPIAICVRHAVAILLSGTMPHDILLPVWSVPLSIGGGTVTVTFFLRRQEIRRERVHEPVIDTVQESLSDVRSQNSVR
jgi:hypothetical protein